MDGDWWSWASFVIGMFAGAFLLCLMVGVFALGAQNDEIQPSVEKKPEKKRNVH